MAIIVVCRSCLKSFQVSEKFAGKSGPCPNCKAVIKVPTLAEQVKIQDPTVGKGKSGFHAEFKPVGWKSAKIEPITATFMVAASLVTLFLTWIGGKVGVFHHTYVLVIGLWLVSLPLVVAAYRILHNDDLEPYRGKSLYLRSAICATVYVLLWGIFSLLSARGIITGDVWIWMFVIPPFFAIGGLAALAALDLEYGDAVLHFGFYVLVTLILRWAAGMKWVWDLLS
jgi:hypothetical protein